MPTTTDCMCKQFCILKALLELAKNSKDDEVRRHAKGALANFGMLLDSDEVDAAETTAAERGRNFVWKSLTVSIFENMIIFVGLR